MQKRIVLIDAIRVIIEELDKVFSENIPGAEIIHIVDEGLMLFEEAQSKSLARRFCNLAVAAEEIRANVIVITCAHGIPFVNTIQMLVETPVVQITLPMIEAAVDKGNRIGLVATEKAIIEPIVGLFEGAGQKKDKRITVKVGLCEEAFRARLLGDTGKSDDLLIRTITDISKTVDVVVLAQISSGRVVPKVKDKISAPILSPLVIAAKYINTLLVKTVKD